MEEEVKISFWKKLKISIFGLEDYKKLVVQKTSKTILYIVLLMLIFTFFLTFAITYKFSQKVNLVKQYIEQNIDFLHDYKSTLQELAQTVKKSIIYEVVDEEGPAHNKKFTSIVKVDGIIMGKGTAGSKKASEQEAAKDALSKRAGIK